MDSSLYAQQSQSQSQYSSPLYMQHVYPQQQYQLYGIVPPTWTPSPAPYFETPLVRQTWTPAAGIRRYKLSRCWVINTFLSPPTGTFSQQ